MTLTTQLNLKVPFFDYPSVFKQFEAPLNKILTDICSKGAYILQKELIDFVEQLNTKQFEEVQRFFDTMPKLKHTIEVENPKTKVKSKIVLQGLNDFFE